MAKRRALLIGVPEYVDDTIVSFREVVRRDLEDLERSLRASGYQDIRSRGLENLLEVTRTRIIDELERFVTGATEGDTLLVYLSGHGLHHGGRDYLVPYEAVLRDPAKYDDYFVRIDFASIIERSKAETIVLFIDACRQGVKQKQKASYAVGWGRGEREKAQRKCYIMIFACETGEFAQYVTGDSDNFSLFTRALSDVLSPEHPARTLGEVLEGTNQRLSELVTQFERNPQRIQKVAASYVEDDESLARVICDSQSKTATRTTGNVWTTNAVSSELWEAEHLTTDPALPEVKNAVSAIVDKCWRQWDAFANATPTDPWHDEFLPVRVLKALSTLVYRSDPPVELTAGEIALAITAPFIREAVIASGAAKAAAVNPLSLEITGVTEEGPRAELEKIFNSFPQLLRKASRLVSQGKGDDQAALAYWLMYRSVLRNPRIWLPQPTGALPESIVSAFKSFEDSNVATDTLTLRRVLELSKCVYGDPERIERHDRPDALQEELFLGGDTLQRRVREKLAAYLLVIAGRLAIDPRLLSDVLVDHLGLADPLTPGMIVETIRSSRWSKTGRTLSLSVECPHQALDLALTEHIADASQTLEAITARKEIARADLVPLNGLPVRLTGDQIRAALDSNNQKVYEIPHVKFTLAQDEVRELLMGEQLYGDPALAIRELYQNALDACRYRRARLLYLKQTGQLNPALKEWNGQITFRQGEDAEGRPYIECEDNGIGMGRRELSECFAQAGRRFHDTPEFIEEQAEWRKVGIELHPNSQFGIGVFSYFMLADELIIETCRLDRRGMPGNRIKARVSGSGTLFRVTEEPNTTLDAGTRIRLYVNRTTHTFEYREERISCVSTLRRILWLTEFETTAIDGENRQSWLPNVLDHPKLSADQCVASSSRDLWWIAKTEGGEIAKNQYKSDGAILADGIFVAMDYGAVPLNFVVNLSGAHRPTLSVDRKKILKWDSQYVEELLIANCLSVKGWQHLSLSWLWLLDKESREATERLTKALVDEGASLKIGFISWHFDETRMQYRVPFSDRGWQHRRFEIRKLGCFPPDIELFREAHETKLRALDPKFEPDRYAYSRYEQALASPEWLKPYRLALWRNHAREVLSELSGWNGSPETYNNCPTLYPKDIEVFRVVSREATAIEVLRAAAETRETIGDTITRLKRLSPLGIKLPELILEELHDELVDMGDANVVNADGSVNRAAFLTAAAKRNETIGQAYARLSRFTPLGVQLPDFNLPDVQDVTLTPEEVLPLDNEARITAAGVVNAAAATGRTLAEVLAETQKLVDLGCTPLSVPLDQMPNVPISKADADYLTVDWHYQLDIAKLANGRKESIGQTLRRLQQFKGLGLSVPDADPAALDELVLSEEEMETFKYDSTISLKQLLELAARTAQPVVELINRWSPLSLLGVEVPAKIPADVPDFTLNVNDLLLIEGGNRVTASGILKTSAETQTPIAALLTQVEKLKQIGCDVPELSLQPSNVIASIEDSLFVNENGRVTLRSLLAGAAQLKETVAETYDRAQQLTAIGIKAPKWDRDRLAELIVDEEEVFVISDRNEINLLGFLWLSALREETVAKTSARLDRLQKFGITIPRLALKTSGDLVFDRDDVSALLAAIIVSRHDVSIYEWSEVFRNLFVMSPDYPFRYVVFNTGEFLRSEFTETFPMYLTWEARSILASVLQEPFGQIIERIRKFEVLGLEFTTDP